MQLLKLDLKLNATIEYMGGSKVPISLQLKSYKIVPTGNY